MSATPWKPAPGTPASRVVELLRFLPAGTALNADQLRSRADINTRGSLHIHLHQATSHGLLLPIKRREGTTLRTYWTDGRGLAVWANQA